MAADHRRRPRFAAYQRKTDRELPILCLTPTQGAMN
jgi:hypothetical protein